MGKNQLIIILFLVLGAITGLLLVPVIHGSFETDFSRTKLIINTLKNPEFKTDYVFLGNSILMNGVDANLFSEKKSGAKAFNLSSTGQKITESILYYQYFENNPTTIVQFVSVDGLLKTSESIFDARVVRNFRMFGYEAGASTRKILPDSLNALFDKQYVEVLSAERSIVPNLINQSMRKALRKDLNTQSLLDELYYPYTYNKRLGEKTYNSLIDNFNPTQKLSQFEKREPVFKLIEKAAEELAQNSTKLIVVIPPINPDLINYSTAFLSDMDYTLQNRPNTNVQYINLTSLLESTDFIDHIHPGKSGAKKITLKLAEIIK